MSRSDMKRRSYYAHGVTIRSLCTCGPIGINVDTISPGTHIVEYIVLPRRVAAVEISQREHIIYAR